MVVGFPTSIQDHVFELVRAIVREVFAGTILIMCNESINLPAQVAGRTCEKCNLSRRSS